MRGSAVLVEKRLQNDSCGHLVDYFAMILPLVAGMVKDLVSLVRSQPLVPQVDRQTGQLAKLCGKGLRFCSLRAHFTGEMHGVAYHDPHHPEAPAEPRQRTEILAPVVPPLQRHNRLRRQTKLIRHGHADAAIADIEAEIAGMWGSFQLLASSLRPEACNCSRNAPLRYWPGTIKEREPQLGFSRF